MATCLPYTKGGYIIKVENTVVGWWWWLYLRLNVHFEGKQTRTTHRRSAGKRNVEVGVGQRQVRGRREEL